MKPVTKENIDLVATTLASAYSNDPLQAAFIFDRIFLRDSEYDLKPERQFVLVDEDCSAEMGAIVRAIHTEYMSSDPSSKNELKSYAQERFIAEFNKVSINFLEHYTPHKKSGVNLVSFDATVGRLNMQGSSSYAFAIHVGGKPEPRAEFDFASFFRNRNTTTPAAKKEPQQTPAEANNSLG